MGFPWGMRLELRLPSCLPTLELDLSEGGHTPPRVPKNLRTGQTNTLPAAEPLVETNRLIMHVHHAHPHLRHIYSIHEHTRPPHQPHSSQNSHPNWHPLNRREGNAGVMKYITVNKNKCGFLFNWGRGLRVPHELIPRSWLYALLAYSTQDSNHRISEFQNWICTPHDKIASITYKRPWVSNLYSWT